MQKSASTNGPERSASEIQKKERRNETTNRNTLVTTRAEQPAWCVLS